MTNCEKEKIYELHHIFSPKAGFISEKKMCDLIEANIADFTKKYLGSGLKSYVREYRIGKTDVVRQGGIRPRADFMIETMKGERIVIECKNKTRLQDSAQGIAQLLIYGQHEALDRYILVTSNFSSTIFGLISQHKLPIEVLLFNENSIAYVPR